MGISKRDENRQNAGWWAAKAQSARQQAHEAKRKADECRRRLASGKSDDPAADRYMARVHDGDRSVASANARDYEAQAKYLRKAWF